MKSNDHNGKEDKLSMGLSVFIALCVVSVFCAISIAILENINPIGGTEAAKHVNLPNNRESTDLLY